LAWSAPLCAADALSSLPDRGSSGRELALPAAELAAFCAAAKVWPEMANANRAAVSSSCIRTIVGNMVMIARTSLLLLVSATSLATSALAQPARFEALANSAMAENRPTSDSAAVLRDELLFQRATQSYLWALPLINTLGMKIGSEATFGAGYHVLPIWKRRLDAKTLVTTPNSDVIYAMSYIDLGKDGPIVMDAPPGLQGILLDMWQRPIPVDGGPFEGDVGLAGPDRGAGGKFLIVPPGYSGPIPANHYVYRSATNNVFVFLRGFYTDPANLKPAVAELERTRLYPLGGEATARAMVFPDASGVPVNMLPDNTIRAFEQVKALLDSEPASLASADGLGALAAIGIQKGKPFAPDARTRAILDAGARTGYKMSRVIGFSDAIGGNTYRMYPDRKWLNPFDNISAPAPEDAINLAFQNPARNLLSLDSRIWYFTNYYSLSPGMLSKTPGRGAAYMMAFVDATDQPLSGDGTYRLRLPANIPAANFWSVTLYEAENASGLANGQAFPSLGSRDKPAVNADGSTDLYLAPAAPAGKRGNWLATVPGKGYFAILRLYGPTEPALEKRWKPGDIERIK
jgi:hypothetical protein